MSEHSSRGTAWAATRLAVLDRDRWTCQYCHKALDGDDATVDHIVSKARWKRENRPGNPDHPDNLRACCRACNAAKGDRDELPRRDYYNPHWFPLQAGIQDLTRRPQ